MSQVSAVRSVLPNLEAGLRCRETGVLIDAFHELDNGTGNIVEVVGDPGAGKTWLLTTFAAEIGRLGHSVLRIRYTEDHRSLAFQIDGQVPGETPDAMRRLLAARARDDKLVVMLDDFHWADDASVEFVDHLIRRPVEAPVMLVLAHRPRQASSRLRGTLAHGVELGSVKRAELGPLSLEQSAELLGMPAADRRLGTLHRESDGVPVYLLALAESGPGKEVPYQFAALLDGEVTHLNATQALVTEAAAVLAGGFSVEDVAAVAELDVGEVRAAIVELTERDLIRPIDETSSFAFRHPLIGRAIYARTSAAWRVPAHRRAAELLARRNAPASARAVHLEHVLAGSNTGDIEVLRRASEDALVSDPASAVRWLKAALRVQPENAPGRADLSLSLARALGLAGRLQESRDLLHTTVDLIPTEDQRARASALVFRALIESLLGNYAEARALLSEEIAPVLATDDPPPHAAEVLIAHGLFSALDSRVPSCDQVNLAKDIARRHDDALAEAGAFALSGLCDVLHEDIDSALDMLSAGAAVIDRLSDAELVPHPEYAAALGWAETLVGRFGAAGRHFRRAVSVARRRGHTHLLPVMLLGLGNIHRHIGDPVEAWCLAAQARAMAEVTGAEHIRGLALALQALAVVHVNGPAAASASGEEAIAALRGANPYWNVAAVLALAQAARLGGEPRRCVRLVLDAGGGPTLPTVPAVMHPACYEMLARASADAADAAAAGTWARNAEAAASALALPVPRAFALAARAHALSALGDTTSALAHYRRAIDTFSSLEMIEAQARTLAAAAECAAAAGRREDAEFGREAAKETARRAGATWLEAEIDRGGPSSMPAVPSRPERLSALTNREREIAGMAGVGLKTREIADKLSVSPRTVDVHLTRIYRKLRIDSRTALARLMAEIG